MGVVVHELDPRVAPVFGGFYLRAELGPCEVVNVELGIDTGRDTEG
jgi:hypothetical protein